MQSENKIVFKSFRKYWHLIALTVFFSLTAAVFEGMSLGLLIPFLQNISDPSSSAFGSGWAFIDKWVLGVGAPQLERLYRICGLILLATWIRSGFGYAAAAFGMEGRALIVEDLRMRIIDQLQAVSLEYFSRTKSGEIINSLSNELVRVGQSLSILIAVITRSSLLLVYISFMYWISWQLSTLVIVFFGLLSIGLTRLIALIRASGEHVTRASGRFTTLANEFIGGIKTVVAFNMQGFERDRLDNATNGLARAIIRTARRYMLVQPLSQAVVGTVLIVVVVLATQYLVLPGKLDIALLLTFLFALFRLMPIVHELNNQRGQWAGLRAAISNVVAILRTDDKPYLVNGTRKFVRFENQIEFDAVTFAYNSDEIVLSEVDATIERGQTTAIVGASGAGKSTLVDLIPRFYDPISGSIRIDGVDVREFDVHSLRSKIALVSQSTYIFNDTIRANIAYGAPEVPLDRVKDVAEQANALEFIENMPNGFETKLGDQGVRLSGGQRQRIAIARALLRKAEILILDEATSALDSMAEKLVQQSLERLMVGRTVIAIAHRLSTVENADKVIVLENGQVIEQGTYEELIESKGQLWEYHALQFQLH